MSRFKSFVVSASGLVVLALLATATQSPAYAQADSTAATTSAADPCADPQDQSTMNICAENDYQKADQKLTTLYKSFRPVPAKLKEAERAWIAYRDAECDFEGSFAEGGSMQPMLVSGCMATLTKERIATLKGDQAGQ
jgi:uncharacterized protein YecT (DUF1311 family)